MGILGWVVIGLVVGFVVSKLINLRGDDPKLGVFAAVGGAVAAGVLHAVVSGAGVTAWNFWSLLFAAIGAAVAVAAWHLIRSRSISRERYVPRQSY
jgi:uncharacterized membrane protein YeaQ/YmgE (transglycosylase-associated protein family)